MIRIKNNDIKRKVKRFNKHHQSFLPSLTVSLDHILSYYGESVHAVEGVKGVNILKSIQANKVGPFLLMLELEHQGNPVGWMRKWILLTS